MFGQANVVGFSGWVDDAVGTLLERCFELFAVSLPFSNNQFHYYQGNNVGRLRREFVC